MTKPQTDAVSNVFNEFVNLEKPMPLYVNNDKYQSVEIKYEMEMRSHYAKFFSKQSRSCSVM